MGISPVNIYFIPNYALLLQDIDVDVVALVNDTTGTQLAVGLNDPNCHVGLILGTGTNACYMENIDQIPKYDKYTEKGKYSKVIINCEWGAFGDDGKLDPYLTEYDKQLDELVVNKGQQTYILLPWQIPREIIPPRN